MKKFLFVLLIALFTVSFVYAEQSAQTYSGNNLQSYREQQVFADFYNNSGGPITSNSVVILDTAVTSGSLLGTAITTTVASNSTLVVGVSDVEIATASVGRVCVRGPHKCFLASTANMTAGATLATCGYQFTLSGPQSGKTILAGAVIYNASGGTGAAGGVFGTLLSASAITKSNEGLSSGDGNYNYWVYLHGLGSN